jgi:endonuclease/exonuclease/phosphatase family metal-dependent hydrolase
MAQVPAQGGAPLCGVETPRTGVLPLPDDGVLRVATYNVLHSLEDYADETLSRRLDLIADALTATDADAVGIQEAVRSTNHGLVAQRLATALADRDGHAWSWCWYQSNPHLPGEPDTAPGGAGGPVSQQMAQLVRAGDSPWAEGVGILARGAISRSAAHRLVSRAPEAPACQVGNPTNPLAIPICVLDTRTVLWAEIESACGSLDFFTSHLVHTMSPITEEVRLVQMVHALATIDMLASDGATPDVYVGDFNTLEGSPVWQAALDAGFVDAFRVAEPTDPGFTSHQDIAAAEATVSRRIDYIFARPGKVQLVPVDGVVIGTAPAPFVGSGGQSVVWPSDHFGVAVTLLDKDSCGAAATGSPASAHGTTTVDPSDAPAPPGTGPFLPATGGGPPAAPIVGVTLIAIAGHWWCRRRWVWGAAHGES